MPSNHRRRPRPPAAPRPARRRPQTRAARPRAPVAPRPPVTAAGEAAEGQPGMGTADGSLRAPSSAILPPVPAAWPPSPGARLVRAHPGEGLPLSKGHHPSAVPGLGLRPPMPRPRGRGGPPQISGGDGGEAPHPPPPVPAPSGTSPPAGEGVASFHCWGVGAQVNSLHCLGAVRRGRPSGLLPHPVLPSLPEAPFLPGTPGRDLGRGRRGRATGGDEGWPPPAGKAPSAAPLPSASPKGGEQGEGRGPRGGGGGLPAPPPAQR